MIRKAISIIKSFYKNTTTLSNNGERVDLIYKGEIDFEELDIYQKSHLKRYQFARENISSDIICGDMACGTGYGSAILAEKSESVIGVDIDQKTVTGIQKRYNKIKNLEFVCSDLLDINYESKFDAIISFETVEHLHEKDIPRLFNKFNRALKKDGTIIFSVPYKQEESEKAKKMGFHLTFNIDEQKIEEWLKTENLSIEFIKYQNYETHIVSNELDKKDFIICVAKKI